MSISSPGTQFTTSCIRRVSVFISSLARNYSDSPISDSKKDSLPSTLPEEPTNCCLSGCVNCVWVQYAEQVMAQLKDGDLIARQVIAEKVQDPNLRAFIETELRMMKK